MLLGTVVNSLAVFVGGFLGLLLKNGLRENYKNIINQGVGLAVLFVGASGCISGMLQKGANPVLFIVALAIGGILGELLKIEGKLENLGDWLQKKVGNKDGMGSVSRGFVSASLLFCVGTMAVMGAFESGIQGKHTILYAKSLIDGIIAIVMSSTLGVGVLFSAVCVFIYQSLLTVVAVGAKPFLTPDMMREIGIVGGVLITAIGFNMLGITRIKTGNLLPALFVPVVFYLILGMF